MTTPLHVLLISGSLRSGSVNSAVLRTLAQLAPESVVPVVYTRLGDLPHFNPEADREPLPEPVADLRAQLARSQAVLLSTPEYAGALPGSFKNLLDWTVGEGIHRKPVGWINPSAMGGSLGTYQQLRTVLTYTNSDIVEPACIQLPVARSQIAADGVIADENIRQVLSGLWTALVAHVRQVETAVE